MAPHFCASGSRDRETTRPGGPPRIRSAGCIPLDILGDSRPRFDARAEPSVLNNLAEPGSPFHAGFFARGTRRRELAPVLPGMFASRTGDETE
jgi:hypothetical protein